MSQREIVSFLSFIGESPTRWEMFRKVVTIFYEPPVALGDVYCRNMPVILFPVRACESLRWISNERIDPKKNA